MTTDEFRIYIYYYLHLFSYVKVTREFGCFTDNLLNEGDNPVDKLQVFKHLTTSFGKIKWSLPAYEMNIKLSTLEM